MRLAIASLPALVLLAQSSTTIPKTWDDQALRDWATPIAALNVRPGNFSEAGLLPRADRQPAHLSRVLPRARAGWVLGEAADDRSAAPHRTRGARNAGRLDSRGTARLRGVRRAGVSRLRCRGRRVGAACGHLRRLRGESARRRHAARSAVGTDRLGASRSVSPTARRVTCARCPTGRCSTARLRTSTRVRPVD